MSRFYQVMERGPILERITRWNEKKKYGYDTMIDREGDCWEVLDDYITELEGNELRWRIIEHPEYMESSDESIFGIPRETPRSKPPVLPEVGIPVMLVYKGEPHIGVLLKEEPSYEDTFGSYLYWDSYYNDGQDWEWYDVTKWAYIPSL